MINGLDRHLDIDEKNANQCQEWNGSQQPHHFWEKLKVTGPKVAAKAVFVTFCCASLELFLQCTSVVQEQGTQKGWDKPVGQGPSKVLPTQSVPKTVMFLVLAASDLEGTVWPVTRGSVV